MKKEIRDEFIGALMVIECMNLDCAVEGEDPPMAGLLPAMRNFFDAYKADLNITESLRKQSAEYSASNIELAHQVSELEEKNEHLLEGAGILERKVAELTKEVNELQMPRPGQVKVDPYTVPEDPDAWRKVRGVPEGWSTLDEGALLKEGDVFWADDLWCDITHITIGSLAKYRHLYYRRDDRS